jgi:hypothetical protein
MVNLLYNKGYPCVYDPLLCQEGVCSGCMILLKRYPSEDIKPASYFEHETRCVEDRVPFTAFSRSIMPTG